jgi:hypothetical protein
MRENLSHPLVSLPIIDARTMATWAVYFVPEGLKPILRLFHPVR